MMGDEMVAYEWVLGVALGVAVLIGVLYVSGESASGVIESHQSSHMLDYLLYMFFCSGLSHEDISTGELLLFLVMLVCTYVIIRSVLLLVVMFVLQLFRHDLYGTDVWTFSTRVVCECACIGVCLIAVFEVLLECSSTEDVKNCQLWRLFLSE